MNLTDGTREIGVSENLDAVTIVTLSGALAASSVTLEELGKDSLGYGITLTASGLKGGLTVADGAATAPVDSAIAVGPSQAIVVNIGGMNGSTLIGAMQVGSTDNSTGSITVDATGHGDASADTLKLGIDSDGSALSTIKAGTVTLKLGDVTGPVTTGRITATNVTIEASGAGSTVVVGDTAATADITAKTSLNFQGPALGATTLQTTVASNSTAFSSTVTGGALADAHTFTSAGTTLASFTLSGDLGLGVANTVVVNTSTTGAPSSSVLGQTISLSGLANASTTITAGSGKDTITGSAGNDVIYGGAGADVLTGNGGSDVFTLNGPTDTGVISSLAVVRGTTAGVTFTSSYTPTGGDVIATSTFDKINDFATGDAISTNANSTQAALSTTAKVGTQWTGQEALFSGNYDSSAGTFTFSSSGTSSIYVFEVDGTGGNGNFHAIVLVGYTTTLTTTGATTGLIGAAS